jgi:hypothetical protein
MKYGDLNRFRKHYKKFEEIEEIPWFGYSS